MALLNYKVMLMADIDRSAFYGTALAQQSHRHRCGYDASSHNCYGKGSAVSTVEEFISMAAVAKLLCGSVSVVGALEDEVVRLPEVTV